MRQQEESSDGSMKKSFADISFVCLLKIVKCRSKSKESTFWQISTFKYSRNSDSIVMLDFKHQETTLYAKKSWTYVVQTTE